MDKIEKLFRKISKKDREALLIISKALKNNPQSLSRHIIKVKESDFCRLRKRKFRIIFHHEGKKVIIDSIQLRDEKTYKRLKKK